MTIDIQKLYDLLENDGDLYDDNRDDYPEWEANVKLFKDLFILLSQSLGDRKHTLIGLVLRIQGDFDCFFDEWREVGVMGCEEWSKKGESLSTDIYGLTCFGRGGKEMRIGHPKIWMEDRWLPFHKTYSFTLEGKTYLVYENNSACDH